MVMNFRNGELVGNPFARFSRPVGDSDNLHVVLLCETRNMQGSGVAAGSDQADADLLFRHDATHLSVDGACQSTAGLVASGMSSAMEVMVLQRAPLHSMHKSRATDHSFGSQHSLGLTDGGLRSNRHRPPLNCKKAVNAANSAIGLNWRCRDFFLTGDHAPGTQAVNGG